METTTHTIDADILTAVIAPERSDMQQNAAKAILGLGFNEAQKERMHVLAEKNNRGVISEAEREELDSYLRVGSFLNLMKAKARNSLDKHSD